MSGSADTEIALFLRRVKWAVMGAFAMWVLWLLAPILTPFVVALMLAWLGDPLVDRLEARGRSRNTAVVLVFVLMILLLALALLILVPMIQRQVVTLVHDAPTQQARLADTLARHALTRPAADAVRGFRPTAGNVEIGEFQFIHGLTPEIYTKL